MIKTHENALQYESTNNEFIEFFFKAGSYRTKAQLFYNDKNAIIPLFQAIWNIDKELSFKLLLWLRDCRGGAGNRSGFREIINWIGINDSKWIISNLSQIPELGRWDDLTVLFNTPAEVAASTLWANAINNGNILAAKWCDRKYSSVRKALGIYKEVDFRKLLAHIRKDYIVEHNLSFKNYSEIKYPSVPSVAMARYSNAFKKYDSLRFNEYKENVKKGETKINTSVLFPHDCVNTVLNGDSNIGDLQFENLPNYIDNVKDRIIVIADTSGSMQCRVSGSITAYDISVGLALYCSSKIEKTNPFYKKFITFESESYFKNWINLKFSDAITHTELFDGAIGSTRIDTALNLILNTGLNFNLTQDQMPTALIIVSDMQFSQATNDPGQTPVEICLKNWTKAGYISPKIIYWNTSGYAGAPSTYTKDVALISGFSPSILKSVFAGNDLHPMTILHTALEKYKVNIPF